MPAVWPRPGPAPSRFPLAPWPDLHEHPGLMAALGLIFNYRRTGKFAFHALAGSLEVEPDTREIPIDFPTGVPALIEAIRSQLQQHARVLVGWSFYSPDAARMCADLAAVRAAVDDKRVLHIAGGVHASAEPAATLQRGFDLVARGEGEVLIRELCRGLASGGDPTQVAGIASLEDGSLRLRPRADRITLDDFPPFALAQRRYGPVEITRGCIYACQFCQTPFFSGARFRHRSIDNICGHVEDLCGIGFKDIRFLTPTSLSYGAEGPEPRLDRVEELLRRVRAVIGAERKLFFGTFPSELRPEHVSREALEMMRPLVDNHSLILGGQSGSDQVLAQSRRGHDAATIVHAARLCVAAGFEPHVDFLFGLPGEGEAEVEASLSLADELVALGARVHGHTFMPLPGTPLRQAAPGQLAASTRRRLEVLASKGHLYGQWSRQEQLARELGGL